MLQCKQKCYHCRSALISEPKQYWNIKCGATRKWQNLFLFSISSIRGWRSQWGSDQAHLWVPGDHSFRARETDNEDIPKGREEGEEERQRNRSKWLLRWCHAVWPQRDESPAVSYSQTFLLNVTSVLLFLTCVFLLLCSLISEPKLQVSAFLITTWLDLYKTKKVVDGCKGSWMNPSCCRFDIVMFLFKDFALCLLIDWILCHWHPSS